MRRIAVDAMGGDNAPEPELVGAIAAVRERAIEVILVGDEPRLRALLSARGVDVSRGGDATWPGRLSLRHASQVIEMDEAPGRAFKAKKDSSMRVAVTMAAKGEADAVVSAGNSGAMLACGVFVMKRLRGVERPGIMTVAPTKKGGFCVVLDVGANTAPRPQVLAQFAVLGATYARVVLGVPRAKVAVLSNGEEEGKGTALTREAHRLLKASPSEDFTFVGYAEGRDFFHGEFDVIVTDGFTGNIALKTSEGTTRAIFDMLEAEVARSARFKLGALLLRPAFRALKRRIESEEYGGAPLLGVDGVAVLAHGRATGKALKNAIFTADRLVGAGLTPSLASAIDRDRKRWEQDGVSPDDALSREGSDPRS